MNPTLPSWETLRLVMPEIWLVIAMCVVIMVPLMRRRTAGGGGAGAFAGDAGPGGQMGPAAAALAGLIVALVAALVSLRHAGVSVFAGMLAVDPFSQFFKVLLIVFTALVVAQWLIATRHETAVGDTPDFLCLLLGAAVGMALMASANNLLMIFVATEAASYPSFALAGFRKRHRVGSEGSLKYVVFGSAASAVMVYGMSLIYGMTGTLSLPEVAAQAAAPGAMSPMLAIGILAMFAGIAFKLSAVPLHFWCPDVFQGAPTEVTTFLSVASKGAAVALLLRVLMAFGAAVPASASGGFTGLVVGVAIMGAATATWGNLVAFHQDNIKRLLAYSSIAHAGYMVMAASLAVYSAREGGGTPDAIGGAILFYLVVYLFMNLGAFTVAAIVATQAGTEDIREYAGMSRRSPALAGLLSLFLLSLFGMPGLGGFWGKIFLAASMREAGAVGLVLIAVLFLNTLVSLYYYVRPVYYMYFVHDAMGRPSVVPPPAGLLLLVVCAAALLWTGVLPDRLSRRVAEFAVFDLGTSDRPALSEDGRHEGTEAQRHEADVAGAATTVEPVALSVPTGAAR